MSDPTTETPSEPAAPVSPEVQAMHDALDRGDHRGARARASALSLSDDPALKAAGDAMAARFRRDPWVDAVFVGTGALMLFLAVHYLGHR